MGFTHAAHAGSLFCIGTSATRFTSTFVLGFSALVLTDCTSDVVGRLLSNSTLSAGSDSAGGQESHVPTVENVDADTVAVTWLTFDRIMVVALMIGACCFAMFCARNCKLRLSRTRFAVNNTTCGEYVEGLEAADGADISGNGDDGFECKTRCIHSVREPQGSQLDPFAFQIGIDPHNTTESMGSEHDVKADFATSFNDVPVEHSSSEMSFLSSFRMRPSNRQVFTAYDTETQVEYYSQTHNKWLPGVVCVIVDATQLTAQNVPTVSYNVTLKSSLRRQSRADVALQEIRTPIINGELVEINCVDGVAIWVPAVVKLPSHSLMLSSISGYQVTLLTESEGVLERTIDRVPNQCIRRRFSVQASVQVYAGPLMGWFDAVVVDPKVVGNVGPETSRLSAFGWGTSASTLDIDPKTWFWIKVGLDGHDNATLVPSYLVRNVAPAERELASKDVRTLRKESPPNQSDRTVASDPPRTSTLTAIFLTEKTKLCDTSETDGSAGDLRTNYLAGSDFILDLIDAENKHAGRRSADDDSNVLTPSPFEVCARTGLGITQRAGAGDNDAGGNHSHAFLQNGSLVEYFSRTHRLWVGGRLQTISPGNSFGDCSEYVCNVVIKVGANAVVTRKRVPLCCVRIPFSEGELVEVLLRTPIIGCSWLPAVVASRGRAGDPVPRDCEAGYTVCLSDLDHASQLGGVFKRIPAGHIRRRFPKGSRVRLFRGPAVGWVPALVEETFEAMALTTLADHRLGCMTAATENTAKHVPREEPNTFPANAEGNVSCESPHSVPYRPGFRTEALRIREALATWPSDNRSLFDSSPWVALLVRELTDISRSLIVPSFMVTLAKQLEEFTDC